MQSLLKIIQKPLLWLGGVIAAELLKPLEEIKDQQIKQGEQINGIKEHIEQLHRGDPDAKECDMSVMHYLILQRIDACRAKGYTTAEDRLIVGRMFKAYKKRDGNHGVDGEFKIFEALPTEEKFKRTKGETA